MRSVFQPIVEIDTGRVVAYEALARGPRGPLERPDELFAAARAAARLAELDQVCRTAALRGALEQGLTAPLTLFVNVEPEVLDSRADGRRCSAWPRPPPAGCGSSWRSPSGPWPPGRPSCCAPWSASAPMGWGVAVDDVGAEPMSLAFMPLLRPDVVKLDLRLVQERPGPEVAEIMNAVNAYAERTGARRPRRGHRARAAPGHGPRSGRHPGPGLVLRPPGRRPGDRPGGR